MAAKTPTDARISVSTAIRWGYGGTSERREPRDRQRTDEWLKTSRA